MPSGAIVVARRKKARRAVALVSVLIIGLAEFAIVPLSGSLAERDVRATARETLAVQAQVLEGLLDKFSALPGLVRGREEIVRFLDGPNAENHAAAQRTLSHLSALTGALDIAVFDPAGRALVSGHDAHPGALPAAGALLQTARQGQLGRQTLTLGSGEMAYAIATAARRPDGTIAGIVAVLVRLDRIQQVWSLFTYPVYVATPDGTTFLYNTAYEAMRSVWATGNPSLDFWSSWISPTLVVMRHLPLLNWDLHVVADATPIIQARMNAALLVLLLGAVACLLALSYVNRHFSLIQRLRQDRASALRLERLVRNRTKQLRLTNESLIAEVEERRRTEHALRVTQDELVQSGKLAALGKMSAALSHEINQPLTAVRTYAANALQLVDLKRLPETKQNIANIIALVDRVAEIARHLRNFARKPLSGTRAVALGPVVDDAVAVLCGKLSESGIVLDIALHDRLASVRGGHVRLQQVLVNIIGNAIDAVQSSADPKVTLRSWPAERSTVIEIEDNGHGISEEQLSHIFDPFYTTKEPGAGMGLGLSISFNIVQDFGGTLTARNAPAGGAIFRIELETIGHMASAAE